MNAWNRWGASRAPSIPVVIWTAAGTGGPETDDPGTRKMLLKSNVFPVIFSIHSENNSFGIVFGFGTADTLERGGVQH